MAIEQVRPPAKLPTVNPPPISWPEDEQQEVVSADQVMRATAAQIAAQSTPRDLPARQFAEWTDILLAYIQTGQWPKDMHSGD